MRPGHMLSLGGALTMVGALWLSWYTVHLPDEVTSAIGGEAGNLPPGWAEFVRGLAAVLAGSLSASGWEALRWADVVLAVIAAVVVAVAFVATESAAALARAGGLAGVVVVLTQIVDQPGPNEFLTVEPGAWVALFGAVAVAIGGVWAATTAAPSPTPTPTVAGPGSWEPATSVPPPSSAPLGG